jgi:hypothetical protein
MTPIGQRIYHPRTRAWFRVAIVDGHRRWVRCEAGE